MPKPEWKIITVSNFDLESYRQIVVAEHIAFPGYAETMLKALKETYGEDSSIWYKLVPQSQPLWLGMEEFADTVCETCGADLYGKVCCLSRNI